VICLAPVIFVVIGLRAVSDQFVSPLVAGVLVKDIGLGNDGGNAVLLIESRNSVTCGVKIGQLLS